MELWEASRARVTVTVVGTGSIPTGATTQTELSPTQKTVDALFTLD